MQQELNCGKADPSQLGKAFWESRYQAEETGWDIGYASPALVEYMKQVENKNAAILIPGAGNAYEVQALLDLGFENITVIDIAAQPIERLQNIFQSSPDVTLIEGDFFELQGKFDYILEQTFFCALSPSLRLNYVHKMHNLLNENGTLAGLFFNSHFEKDGPPFGGNSIEYKSLFRGYFNIQTMELCFNSIPPRENAELFVIMKKINRSID